MDIFCCRLLDTVFAIFLGLCLALLLLFFKSFFWKQDIRARNLPRGSEGWPLLGETLAFLSPHRSNSLGSFLQDHCSRYGKVFKSHLFGSPTIVSCDHELNTFVLQNEERLFQASYPKPMHGILGKYSLLVVSGDLHKKLRSVAVNFVTASKSSSEFHRCVDRLSVSMLESWKGRQQVAFCKEAKMFALSLMVKTLLSIEPEDPRARKILADFLTYMKGFVSLPLYIPGTPYAMAVKARARLSSTVREIIEERRRTGSAAGLKKGDFMDVILGKEELNEEEMVSIVLDILLGGYETTATLMALIVFFLAHEPASLLQLKEEHLAIRRKKGSEEPLNGEDYKQMEYTNDVICEALRCLTIPSGWKVFPIFVGTHLDPTLHENPMKFDPLRWKDKAISKKVMPFGGGLRLCPGAELARLIIAFFLHHLVLSFRWKTEPDDFPIAYPYVEFKRDLVLEIEPTENHS
ncbi:cytochrome P450 724B1 [Eucalyptus grandis]|uniref:cytochrome P450 724B1 n=1 Tax=Eucalyptus grandis TaxID=71139 RepID=UPI00192F01E0|nr:cytochrome P450 724B1 [Eucalyptus grandis]